MDLSFRHFDPIKGPGPRTLPTRSPHIIARARELVRSRSGKQLRAALKAVNWMLSQSPAEKETLRAILRQAGHLDRSPRSRAAPKQAKRSVYSAPMIRNARRDEHSNVYALLRCTTRFDIAGIEGLPNATWAELFAVLALGLIDRACDDEQYYGAWHHDSATEWLHRWRVEIHASIWNRLAKRTKTPSMWHTSVALLRRATYAKEFHFRHFVGAQNLAPAAVNNSAPIEH